MQRIFSALKSVLNGILILSLVGLMLSGLFTSAEQAIAAPISTGGQKLIQQERMDKESQAANNRAQEYEAQIEAEKDPDKIYEENLKTYESSHPGENAINRTIEGAEKLVEKVTGKE